MRRLAPGSISRCASLLALALLALHQLRYLLAFGSESGAVLEQHGHSYLEEALPAVVGLSLALLAARLLIAIGGRSPAGTAGLGSAPYALALLGAFAAQETIEGVLVAHHPAGVLAVFSAGWWLALPLAWGLGRLCAIADRALGETEDALAAETASIRFRHGHPVGFAPPADRPAGRRLPPLAFGLARRPPPPAP